MSMIEANFDGLIGPTHNYAGLALGNVASKSHQYEYSYPKQAALQGLEKMMRVARLGIPQAVLPPHARPDIAFLRRLGFSGSEHDILSDAVNATPDLFSAAFSASSMWAANAATVSASVDTADRKIHITPANLCSNMHRAIESRFTGKLFKRLFANESYFTHHSRLPSGRHFMDEGAANHCRLCSSNDVSSGYNLFVYGYAPNDYLHGHVCSQARHSLLASQAIARSHGLLPERTFFLRQNPNLIQRGIFHNDVICMSHENLLIYHEQAFVNADQDLLALRASMNDLQCIVVEESMLSVDEALQTYFFNSQVLSTSDDGMMILAPDECRHSTAVISILEKLMTEDTPIQHYDFIDCEQSMRNGGGPACLRLRILLNEEQRLAVHPGVWLDERLYTELMRWIEQHYRDRLSFHDLLDMELLRESERALDELSDLLDLGAIYPFQSYDG